MAGRLLTSDEDLRALLGRARRIAVLGIKTEAQRGQPAIDVPRVLERAGYEIVPVPVYYPEVTEIMRQPVYRRLVDVPGHIDLVNVFRRPTDLMPHLDDILAAKPDAVWLQLGIAHDEFAAKLVEAGIDVVQDRCIQVEYARLCH